MTRGRTAPDTLLLLGMAALLALGLVMVLSSSAITAGVYVHDPFYYFKRQLLWVAVGTVAFGVCLRIDYWHWQRWAPWILAATLLLLVAVLIPGIGRSTNGSRRWLGVGSAVFQPSELAKLTMVVFVAAWLVGRGTERIRRFSRTTLPVLGMVGGVAALILMEPDLGTAASLVGTALVMLYAVGVPPSQFTAIFGITIPVLAGAIFSSTYRRERFLAFLNPQANPLGQGYHILQALYALGSGGIFGVGLGQSRQKYFYLPEPYTDTIFAVLGEELGLLGGILVLALFGLVIWRGFRIAANAPDLFGTMLAAGITAMLAIQAIVNLGVVTGMLPVTGIPLPLISYGGSSLVFTMAGIGMLANISRHAR